MEKRERAKSICMRMLALLLCLVPCFVMQTGAEETAASEPVCYEHGDVNGDGGVDSRDAVYVLYHCLFEDEPEYAIAQDCDFNKDGEQTSADAVYLLYSSFGGALEQSHPLEGTVHQYYAPLWSWQEDGTAEVTLQCGCGQTKQLTEAEGVSVSKTKQTQATCVDAGVVEYTASVTLGDTVYTDTKQVLTPAAGHTMEGLQGCATDSVCTLCGYRLESLGHDWVLDGDSSSPATCTSAAVQVYQCANAGCGAQKEITLEGFAEHAYTYDRTEDLGDCGYQEILKCSCGKEISGEVYYQHQYTAQLTKEANCRETGIKTFTCACGDCFQEIVPVNGSHSWVKGDTVDGITTYSCACGETKTAVCAEGSEAAMTKETLQSSGEVQIQDVSLSLSDNAINSLGDHVQIQIDTASAQELALDAQTIEQIGSNPVYDITLLSDDTAVSELNGTATVSVPYTLQQGDDVDCIDVWFISDDGTVSCVQGTYSNGYVTFTTTHFSYYTVTRLTPAQRCEVYGHAIGISHADATCTKDGYHKERCQRCGYVQADQVLEKVAHSYEEQRTEPTCTQEGSFEKVCTSCGETVSGEIPALGHSWQVDEARSVEASCDRAGKTVYVCGHEGCDGTYTQDIPQLEHDFGEAQQTQPDCSSSGQETRVCKLCGYEDIIDHTAPTGHDFREEDAVWEWSEDNTGAAVTLVCARDASHTKTLTAVVSSKTEGYACQGNGTVTYTATASFNKVTYTQSKTVELEQAEHEAGLWQTGAAGHYRICENCKEKVDAGAHVWGQQTVITEPTCSSDGLAKQTCAVCGYSAETVLEATREHNFENGICTECGFEEGSCSHIRTHKTPLDLSGYDVCEGTDIRRVSCDCGEVRHLYIESVLCNMVYSEREETLPNGNIYYVSISTCQDCGLVIEQSWYPELEEETCYTTDVQTIELFLGDTLIASGRREFSEGESSGQHIADIAGETVDLSQYGDLCGVILEEYHCHCGERSYLGIKESSCRWTRDEEQCTDTLRVYECSVCGAVRREATENSVSGENCTVRQDVTVSYEKDGQEIYSYTNAEVWIRHDYQITEQELDGDSCTDGVYLKQVCRDCGKVLEEYTDYHMYLELAVTELDGCCYEELVQSGCACGEVKSCYLRSAGNSFCEFEYIDEETHRCTVCGLTEIRTTEEGVKDENCESVRSIFYTYQDQSGNTVASGEEKFIYADHNWNTEFELLGQSCEDGVKVSSSCQDCGAFEQYTTHSHAQEQTVYNLADYGLCGGTLRVYQCACGERTGFSRYNECDWYYISEDGLETVWYCPDCGVTRTETCTEFAPAGTCLLKQNVTLTYTKDQETLLEVTAAATRENHREVYTLTGDCDTGCQVQMTCLTCGETDQWNYNGDGHNTWAAERKWLSQGTLCGDLELITYRCACGEVTETGVQWHGGECSFENENWLNEEACYVSTCTGCGVTRSRTVENGKIPDTCLYEDVEKVTYSKNGSTLFTYETRNVYEDHAYVASFRLFGTTCADGFEVTETCADCGDVRIRTNYEGNCNRSFTKAREVLYDGEDICGNIVKIISGCACGQNQDIYISDNSCNWEYMGYSDGTEHIICRECDLQKKEQDSYEKDPDSCDVTRQRSYTYSKDGTELLKEEFSYTYQNHEYVASFELLGDSCEDGYYVTESCIRCGASRERWFETGHYTWRTEYYDLRDYGICEGEIYRNSCACGLYSDWHCNYGCGWNHTGETDSQTGLDKIYCPACQSYRILGEVGAAEPDSCDWKGTFYAMFTRDGETLLNIQKPVSRKEHRHRLENVVLYDPALGCEGGYSGTMQCMYCDAYYRTSGDDHDTHQTEYLTLKDLYSQACGDGYFSLGQCACEACSRVYWSHDNCDFAWNYETREGEDGYTHYIDSSVCTDCGLSVTEDYYYERTADPCMQYRHCTWTVSAKGESLKTWTTREKYYEHDCQSTYSLHPGSSSCEDGLYVTKTCKNCDYESSWYSGGGSHNHNNYNPDPENSVDLSQYGSVCGGSLVRYVCACGKQQRYDFSPETLCEIDSDLTENWIGGSIDEWHYTSEGQIRTNSDSYVLTCAVTEPDCGLKIRMSEYWLEENCVATEYQTWQLGYDAQTETCAYEFTVETGDRHTYHPYQYSSTSTTLEDGTTKSASVRLCPQCGSSYTEDDYTLNGTLVKTEARAVNTLDNGENKSFTDTVVYDLEHAGYRYKTLESYDVTYGDGTTFWEKDAYAYDFTGGCRRTRTYTNSQGEKSVWQEDCHQGTWSQESIKDPTCTQYGAYWGIYTCKVCAGVYDQHESTSTPTGHSWSWDNDRQLYVCTDCGLENINGASGQIVLEDLTEAYGEGENYVVGYWNRGGVDALRYVSLVLKDAAEGENDELVLTDIDFTYLTRNNDGINAVSFSQAAVAASAEKAAAAAGYTGSYAIRFTFVPKYSEDTLDYAITFDDLNV